MITTVVRGTSHLLRRDRHVDGHAVGEHVEHRGTRLRLLNVSGASGVATQMFTFMRDQPDPEPALEFYALVTAVSVRGGRPVAQFGGLLVTETIRITR